MRTPHRWQAEAILIVFVGVILGACASGGDEVGAPYGSPSASPAGASPIDETTDTAAPAWPFTEPASGSGEPAAVAAGPPDEERGVSFGEVTEPTTQAWFPDEPSGIDQCSLLPVERWADIRDVSTDLFQSQELEDGRACGILEEEDLVRVAWSVLESPSGSWLPEDLRRQGDYVEIDGASFAEFVGDHPMPGASVLVVDLDLERTQLVVEIMARDDTSERLLRSWATEAAEALVATWAS